MVELTINERNVHVDKGSTILRAALENGIYIPHLCYDKRLHPYGGCRLCLVEVQGQKKLLASCSTPVEKDMVVSTETPRINKARKTVLELLLVHHPLECPECDKAGECGLQDLVFKYGKPEGRFVRHKKAIKPDVRGPLVELNSSRCVLCGRCVRICSEHQGVGALGLIGRGFPTVVQPSFGETLECDYCGQCVDVCPTGAILCKPYKYQARPWFLEEKDSVCPFCGSGCTITLGIREGRILRSRGREDSGVSGGDLCGRGRFGFDYIYGEDRLKTPLIRSEGQLVPASWQEALSYISDNLRFAMQTHGPSSIGGIGSHRCTNEDNYMFSKFMREVVGTENLDSSAYFGYSKLEKALYAGFGVEEPVFRLGSPEGKEIILVVESDPTVTHPVFGLDIIRAKKAGSRLFVADSRGTKLTRHSDKWLRLRPGTSHAFLNGVMKLIVEESLYDRKALEHVTNIKALEGFLRSFSVRKAAEITGIPEVEIRDFAREFAGAKKRLITMSLGPTEGTKGLDAVLSAVNLLILVGEGPEALQVPAEFANTRGLYHAGVRPNTGAAHGMDLRKMLYSPGALKALYIMGEDPLVNFPDSSKVEETLSGLDFLVVQDIALTKTARAANVVLPASGWAEKDGTFTNAEGLSQRLRKLVDAPGQALPDWQIIRNLAQVMGKDIGARSFESLSKEAAGWLRSDSEPFKGLLFNFGSSFPNGSPKGDEDYPLLMVTRDVLQHSGNMSTRSRSLGLVVADAMLEINTADALRLGIKPDSHVKVVSPKGGVYLKSRLSRSVPEGVVFVPTHFPHAGVNQLTSMPSNGEAVVDKVRVEPVRAKK